MWVDFPQDQQINVIPLFIIARRQHFTAYKSEGVMKKIAIASSALAMLAGTPALARVSQSQGN